ncbi:MAG: hypothetical protein ABFD82_14710 [Syntrophaceae bacterium]
MPYIQKGCRFIQQHDLRLLSQSTSNQNSLTLACAQGIHAAVHQRKGVRHLHGLMGNLEIDFSFKPPFPQMRRPPH